MRSPEVSPRAKQIKEIAKKAIYLLGTRRILPTPDAYETAFYEVAESINLVEDAAALKKRQIERQHQRAHAILDDLAKRMLRLHRESSDYGAEMLAAIQAQDYKKYGQTLNLLIDNYLKPVTAGFDAADFKPEKGLSASLRDLLVQLLQYGLASVLHDAPHLAAEADDLSREVSKVYTESDFSKVQSRLRELCFKIEMKGASTAQTQALLVRLFDLLLENLADLLEDDAWVKEQITAVQSMMDGSVTYDTLQAVELQLKKIVYQQSLLKKSLDEARNSIKDMVISFVERLSSMTQTADSYQDRLAVYSEKISQTDNVFELKDVLHSIQHETRIMQNNTKRSLEQMNESRQKVHEAEQRIRELESQLEEATELIHEDRLTGTLNRYGMEEAFRREAQVAQKKDRPMCVAVLDIDNFKAFNMQHGRTAADEALVHLVNIAKTVFRPEDAISRYAGEEFIILLPDTDLETAMFLMQRFQRELTTHLYLHDEERTLITFSAGVGLYQPGEAWHAFLERVCRAMFEAKTAGRNRVFAAE